MPCFRRKPRTGKLRVLSDFNLPNCKNPYLSETDLISSSQNHHQRVPKKKTPCILCFLSRGSRLRGKHPTSALIHLLKLFAR